MRYTDESHQPDLFDEKLLVPARSLPPEVRQETLQLLTQWFRAQIEVLVRESGDE